MSWSIGYDSNWQRDIGYGVPAFCDHPNCAQKIDRGLGHVCGGEPYGGEYGCGLYFCGHHLQASPQLCVQCREEPGRKPFTATPDHPEWIQFKLTDASWAQWRTEHPEQLAQMQFHAA